MSKCKIIYGQ